MKIPEQILRHPYKRPRVLGPAAALALWSELPWITRYAEEVAMRMDWADREMKLRLATLMYGVKPRRGLRHIMGVGKAVP